MDYEQSLNELNLQTLSERREMLCTKFAKKCTEIEKTKDMFPKNNNIKLLKNNEKFYVNFAHTERYKKSAIPQMQRLLNKKFKE